MTGRIIDNVIFSFQALKYFENTKYLETDYGEIRVFDSGGEKPVLINTPDGPNTIEHHLNLLQALTTNYRVVCFEYPGVGFSYPSIKFNYSFSQGSDLLLQVMHILKIEQAALLFSCSNGYYALNAAMHSSQKFSHIFISQTPSIDCIVSWAKKSVPSILKMPIIGQISNRIFAKKLSSVWYDIALPRESLLKEKMKTMSQQALKKGGCFCLSSIVQGLSKEKEKKLIIQDVDVTLIWGQKDFSHRNTPKESIIKHVNNCEIIAFPNSGHFPELENSEKFITILNDRLLN